MATATGSHVRTVEKPGAYARLRSLEEASVLDGAVDKARPLAATLTAKDRIRSVLHGDVTGIPVHAILTDLPFGAWWMAISKWRCDSHLRGLLGSPHHWPASTGHPIGEGGSDLPSGERLSRRSHGERPPRHPAPGADAAAGTL